jgi:metal-responsive CopG/Arc/MetJ family transcriptional regulator
MSDTPKRKGRGLGKKPSMQYVAVRVSREVYDFFDTFPSRSKAMRVALEKFVNDEKEKQNGNAD